MKIGSSLSLALSPDMYGAQYDRVYDALIREATATWEGLDCIAIELVSAMLSVFDDVDGDYPNMSNSWQGQSPLHVVMNMDRRFPIDYLDASSGVAGAKT